MANKKISELQSRTPVLADLMLVGDPSSGYAYKCTITALSTVIETAIGGNYVTLATTQTISGAKTFSNNVTLTSVQNAPTDPDKFLTLNASNVVTYRTGAEVLSDIGGQGSITLTTTGTSGAATLVGNTLNIPQYSPDLSGYVPNTRTLTINGTSYDLSANRTWSVGTVTSVAATAGTGISISGSPITSSGTLTITNTAPDQTVVLTAGTGISVSGTYPSFTIAATSTATISGSGTTNYIPKFTSSSAIGNSVIYDQSGLIGINTTTPGSYNANAYNLVVGGTSDAGITIFGNSAEGSSNLYLADGTTGDQAYRGFLRYTHSNDALTIGTSGITRMTLDASGNLGLGLTPNTWPAGQIAFEFGSLGTLVSTGSTVSLQNNSYNNGTNNIRKVIGEASSYNQSGGAHIWQYAASGASGSTISFSEAMRITSGGNVLVGGTSDNGSRLQVTGAATFSSSVTASGGFEIPNGQFYRARRSSGSLLTDMIGIPSGTDDVRILTTGDFNIVNGSLSNILTVKNGGNVGIGTSSPNSISGYTIVDIQNTSNGGLIQLGTNGTGYGQLYNNTGEVQLRTIASIPLVFGTNSSERMRITSGGEVYIAGTADQGAYNLQVNGTGVWGAGAYVNGSDSSLKENIQNMGSALELVNQLQPKTYTYKPSYSKDTTIQVGFIAQDLEQVLGTQIYKNSIVVDGPNFKSVAYQNLIPLLVQSIKELKAEIETLKNK
jgi:hypothetical protein